MDVIMELLKQYFELQKKIYDYFRYKEDWVVIPLDDSTECYWHLTDDEVLFYDKPLTKEIIDDGAYYCNSIYTQRFLPRWVYHGKDYTMICVDTHTDGNKFLQVFDNNKEIKSILE